MQHVTSGKGGFTLVQISILLMIASLVMITILPTSQSKLTSNVVSKDSLTEALLSLRQFHAANGRLPCPADASKALSNSNFGKEAANYGITNDCGSGSPAANQIDATNNIAMGMLPVLTLGLPKEAALDGFGRIISYAVDTNATECGWPSASLTGSLTVTDHGSANTSVVALVSHGQDGHGAWVPLTGSSGTAVRFNNNSTDSDQLTNAHLNSSFGALSTLNNFVLKSPTATFDDVVVYKSAVYNINNLPASAPQISSITPPADGTYSTGQTLSFTVTYNTAVTVTGTPRLALTALGGGSNIVNGGTAYANYASGTGTTALIFSYTVQDGDVALNGLSIAALVDNNGGTIKAGNACAGRWFTAPDLSAVIIQPPYIYVADTTNNRIQKFTTDGIYVSKWGSAGSGNGQFNVPVCLAADSTGNIYVFDSANSRIQKFDGDGNWLLNIGSGAGSGNGQFAFSGSPSYFYCGLAVDSSGNIYVSDYYNSRVQKFNSSGAYVTKWGSGGSGNGQFNAVEGVGVDSSGYVYVADYNNTRIQKFDSNGTYISQFATNGTTKPWSSVAVDSSGNIYVPMESSWQIQKFNSTGTYQITFCGYGSGDGQCMNPPIISVDSSGNVWVADGGNNRIQKFNSSGVYQSQFGSSGSGNGQFNTPGGIVVTSR